jgi:hypothetical protein
MAYLFIMLKITLCFEDFCFVWFLFDFDVQLKFPLLEDNYFFGPGMGLLWELRERVWAWLPRP